MGNWLQILSHHPSHYFQQMSLPQAQMCDFRIDIRVLASSMFIQVPSSLLIAGGPRWATSLDRLRNRNQHPSSSLVANLEGMLTGEAVPRFLPGSDRHSKTAAPNLFGTRDPFVEDNFSTDEGNGGGLGWGGQFRDGTVLSQIIRL